MNPHITGIKAAATQDQHVIFRPDEEVISTRLPPEDDSSTMVLNKSGSMWCQSAHSGPCLLPVYFA